MCSELASHVLASCVAPYGRLNQVAPGRSLVLFHTFLTEEATNIKTDEKKMNARATGALLVID